MGSQQPRSGAAVGVGRSSLRRDIVPTHCEALVRPAVLAVVPLSQHAHELDTAAARGSSATTQVIAGGQGAPPMQARPGWVAARVSR
jgi:hypothetical protein